MQCPCMQQNPTHKCNNDFGKISDKILKIFYFVCLGIVRIGVAKPLSLFEDPDAAEGENRETSNGIFIYCMPGNGY